jgi:D-tyrosyl-tRNA(Tyr) deacylase
MKAVVQRVSSCTVTVDGSVTGKIERGLLVYLGVAEDDEEEDITYLARKITGLRVFEDEQGKMNLSLTDLPDGRILTVSQFTLLADTKKGRRPSYSKAASPEKGEEFYTKFNDRLRDFGFTPETGMFRASMQVTYTNDGPVTIIIDSKQS